MRLIINIFFFISNILFLFCNLILFRKKGFHIFIMNISVLMILFKYKKMYLIFIKYQ